MADFAAAQRVVAAREAAGDGNALTDEQSNTPAAATVATMLYDRTTAGLEASLAEIAKLKERLATMEAGQHASIIDPALVDVPGFNRLPSSFDAALDPEFADLLELIRTYGGNKQPGMVRPDPGGGERYELVYGERRMRACQQAGQPFRAIVAQISDDEVRLLRELENAGRKNKSLLERAYSLGELAEHYAWGERSQLLELLKVSQATYHRLRAIMRVPLEIWTSIPAPHRLSFRNAKAVCDAYDDDSAGVASRAATMPSDASHDAAIAYLLGEATTTTRSSDTAVAVRGRTLKLSLKVESASNAKKLAKELTQWLQSKGVDV